MEGRNEKKPGILCRGNNSWHTTIRGAAINMIITTVEDCFKFRLLRKISPDKDKVKRSLEVAEIKLKEVPEAIKLGFHSYGILDAYMCMFHAARALLYNDGIQEKSHYAIYIYLKERY